NTCGARANRSGAFAKADAPREFLGRNERGGARGGAGAAHRAVLPEGDERGRPTRSRPGAHAAHSLSATVAQALRSGGRGSVVRLAGDALVRGDRLWWRA